MTSAEQSLSVLLVNDHAEEIKVISTTLRGFFPDCRVEAVYTSEEALQWSLREDWHLLLVDDALSPRSGVEIIGELKRNSPHAAIILQTDRSDSATALEALRQGADFLLFKHSPGFVTELLFYVQEAVEKRALEIKLEHTFQRHLRLVESVSDLVYELDREGRFIYVSSSVTQLLGYVPEELAGRHFSMLVPPTQDHIARYRMNERRSGARSAHQLELYALGKASAQGKGQATLMRLTAKGLYDERRRYLGTVGLLRDLSAERQQTTRAQELEARLQETDRQLAASRDVALMIQHLQQPLSALVQDSQQLLATLQNMGVDERVKQLASYATHATELGYEVWRSIQFRGRHISAVSLNNELQHVIAELSRERSLHPEAIEQRSARPLPGIAGIPHEIRESLRILILYALHSLAGAAGGARLLLETYEVKAPGTAPPSPPAPPAPPFSHHVVVVIRQQTGEISTPIQPTTRQISGSDLLRAHDIVRQHGGSIEIGSGFIPPFQITIRLPATPSLSVPTFSQRMSEPHPVPMAHSLATTLSPSPVTPGERRRFERTDLRLPLELSIGTAAWQGTILNIGLGGMVLTSPEPTPPIEHQPVYLILRTSVSFLEVQGTVRYRSPAVSDTTDRHCFIIEFAPLTEPDAAVLTSFIQSLKEQSAALIIEGLIPGATGRPENGPSRSLQSERRWHVRTILARSVRLTFFSENRPDQQSGLLLNFGQGGACIQVTGAYGIGATRLSVQNLSNSESDQTRLTDESTRQDLPARIVWTAQGAGSQNAWHIGLCFDRLSPESEESLNLVLASQLNALFQSRKSVDGSNLRSSLLFLRNRHGHSLALCHDELPDLIARDAPILIISPGYAHTSVDYVGLACLFRSNRYRVLRYDPTHGLGLSGGDPRSGTLGMLRDDLETVVEFARGQWPHAPIVVLASDLSARAALKLFARSRSEDMLLLVNPILDVGATLQDLHHRDLLEEHKAGSQFGLANLMGLQIDADHFLRDAVAGEYGDFRSTADDIRRLRCRVCFVTTPSAGETLARVTSTDGAAIKRALDILGKQGSAVALSSPVTAEGSLPSAPHRESFHRLITHCRGQEASVDSEKYHDEDPEKAWDQYRDEVERLRTKPHVTRLQRDDLWARYTQHGGVLGEIPAYLQHCNDLYQFVRPLLHHHLLDVGCSHYGFASQWLLDRLYRSPSRPLLDERETRYVGIDGRLDRVRFGKEAFTALLGQTGMRLPVAPAGHPHVSAHWIIGNMAAFPLGDEHFDCIVCHFALNFADNPVITLRELYRLLRPNGRLIVSSFTPCTDLAAIYRARLHETQHDSLSGIHRDILLDLAQLRESIRCRRLHPFTSQSLVALLNQITAQPARTFPTLDNQVLVATVQKPDSAR